MGDKLHLNHGALTQLQRCLWDHTNDKVLRQTEVFIL